MSDLKRRLRDIEGYEPPDLWREIEGREPRALPRVPAGRRVLVVAVAFAVSFAGIGVAVRSFRSSPSSVGEAPVSATVSNGLITFGGGTRIYTMMPDGSGLVVLEDPGAIAYYGPEWSPDGTRIAFYGYPPGGASARYGGGADYDIFVMNPDVSVLTNLTTNPADVKSGFSQMVPSWSPDGSKIAYDGDDGLYVMNADGSDQTRIASGQGASWSPDGTRIVFQGPGGAIWSVAPDGSGLVQLTSGAGSDDFPTYSPDGTSVAYYHPEGSHQVSYVVMSSDGSGQTTVASFQADSWGRPVWSPDGIEIAFDLYRHGTWDIYVVNADGTGLSDLTPTPNRDENTPEWSPDGTRIAFEASDVLARDTDNTGTFDIYVMNPDGTDQTRLTTHVHSMGFDMSWQVVTAAPGSATPSPSGPSPARCVRASTDGDLDGDGRTDLAIIYTVPSDGANCRQDVATPLRFLVQFGSGQELDVPFPFCEGGQCATEAFMALDLDADGRAELIVEVGPGAAVDYIELFRVSQDGIRPLQIEAPGDPGYVEPGPALLGGGFDSGQQSPISCEARGYGTTRLVSVHATPTGNLSTAPWNVHQTVLALQGDALMVVEQSDSTVQGFSMNGRIFRCP